MKKLLLALVFLVGMSLNSFALTLRWQAPTRLSDGRDIPIGTIITYNIYRGYKADGSDLVLLNASPISDLTYTDNTVMSKHIYYYAIRSVRNKTESERSAVILVDLYPTKPPVVSSGQPKCNCGHLRFICRLQRHHAR